MSEPQLIAQFGNNADVLEKLNFEEIELLYACMQNETFVSAIGKVVSNQLRLGVREIRTAAQTGNPIRAAIAEGKVSAFERLLGLLKDSVAHREVSRES